MKKKVYQEPVTEVECLEELELICTSLKNVSSNADLEYDGAGDENARSRGIWGRWED